MNNHLPEFLCGLLTFLGGYFVRDCLSWRIWRRPWFQRKQRKPLYVHRLCVEAAAKKQITPDSRPARGGWAPGPYACHCMGCRCEFLGDKRALSCADCAYANWPEPPKPDGMRLQPIKPESHVFEETADDIVYAQHEETGLTWEGRRGEVPRRYSIIGTRTIKSHLARQVGSLGERGTEP